MQHVDVVTIETTDLGDRSYLVTDGEVAAVVDPQRDVDRVLAVAEERGVRITHVLETHIHNDYVSGGLELARRTGAIYVVAAAEEVAFDRSPVEPGEWIEVGRFALVALHTPGHTPTHVSYVLEAGGERQGVFSGGSLLYGAVGRTDLISPELTHELAHAQYHSAHHLAHEMPDPATLFPTHGFGSFCSSTRGETPATGTVGDERGRNPALAADDPHRFVEELVAGYTAGFPRYYRHMGPLNRSGPPPVDLSMPPRLDSAELARRLDDRGGTGWVVDLRDRRSFAASHAPGALNVEWGDFFATYVGWVLPWEAELTLVGATDDVVAEARRALARIGYDRVTGWAPDRTPPGAPASYRVAGFADLAGSIGSGGVVVLDVRRDDEWREGHLPGAVHVHLPELAERMSEVPPGEVWVHCASGFRAAIAASLLDRAGRRVVLVDDGWDTAVRDLEVLTAA